MTSALSCGVVITDGARLLLGHATASPRWDIPKGLAEAGETPLTAALRELRKETGLIPPSGALTDLGRLRYRPGKDVALFLWFPPTLPDPATLRCTSRFTRHGTTLPELDRFAMHAWADALALVGRDMRRVLDETRKRLLADPGLLRVDPRPSDG